MPPPMMAMSWRVEVTLSSYMRRVFAQNAERVLGHRLGVEAFAHGSLTAGGERLALLVVIHQAAQRIGEIGWMVWLEQEAAAGCFNQFGETAMTRLHDRHAVGPGFQDVQALRLVIDRRHGQDVEALQEADFAGVVR